MLRCFCNSDGCAILNCNLLIVYVIDPLQILGYFSASPARSMASTAMVTVNVGSSGVAGSAAGSGISDDAAGGNVEDDANDVGLDNDEIDGASDDDFDDEEEEDEDEDDIGGDEFEGRASECEMSNGNDQNDVVSNSISNGDNAGASEDTSRVKAIDPPCTCLASRFSRHRASKCSLRKTKNAIVSAPSSLVTCVIGSNNSESDRCTCMLSVLSPHRLSKCALRLPVRQVARLNPRAQNRRRRRQVAARTLQQQRKYAEYGLFINCMLVALGLAAMLAAAGVPWIVLRTVLRFEYSIGTI